MAIELVGVETGTEVSTDETTVALHPNAAVGDVAIALFATDDGNDPHSLPTGFTVLNQYGLEVMEQFVRKVTGEYTGAMDISTVQTGVFHDGRTGVAYVAQPTFDSQVALYQDAAGTTPATADGDPVKYLVDFSGNGHHAIQNDANPAGLTLRTDGTLWWLEADATQNRPLIPAAAFAGGRSTVCIGFDEQGTDNSILLGADGDNSSFMFAALEGSTNTSVNGNVSYSNMRLDTRPLFGPVRTMRSEHWSLHEQFSTFTFEGVEFQDTFITNDKILLGYNSSGWEPEGKFYGLVVVNNELLTTGIDRSNGTLTFRSTVGYRVLDGSEPATLTFTQSLGEDAAAIVAVFRGVDTVAGPFDVQMRAYTRRVLNSEDTTDTRRLEAIETVTNSCWVLHLLTDENTPVYTRPSGVTEIAQAKAGTGTGGAGVAMGYAEHVILGEYPQREWGTDLTTRDPYRTYTIALLSDSPIGSAGAGDLATGAAQVSGTGTVRVTGSGALESAPAGVSGTAGSRYIGEGITRRAERAKVAGTGTVRVTGSGNLKARRAGLDTVGSYSNFVVDAHIQAPRAVTAGVATTITVGTGALVARPAKINSVVGVEFDNAGSLQARRASVNASVRIIVKGTAALQAGPAEMYGFHWVKQDSDQAVWRP